MRPRLLAPVLVLVFGTGCASTITLVSQPPGAQVTVDGSYLGRAPVRYTDSAVVGTVHQVSLSLRGYETLHSTFTRNGPVNPVAACGMICVVPIFWIQGYPRQQVFRLHPHGAVPVAPSPSQSVPPPYPGWQPPTPPPGQAAPPGQGAPATGTQPPPSNGALPPPPLIPDVPPPADTPSR